METKHTPEWIVGDDIHQYNDGHGWVTTVFDNAAPSGSKIAFEARHANRIESKRRARLGAASPIGYALADAVLCQIEDGMDRAEHIRRLAIDFMMQADPDRVQAALEPK